MTGAAIEIRLEHALAGGVASEELHDLLTEGYAYALRLDADGISLRRRTAELAACADDPSHANELRDMWLRQGTLARQLRDLRARLRALDARLVV